MTAQSAFKYDVNGSRRPSSPMHPDLTPSPIRPDWVLEGSPIARNKLVSVSADGTASSFIWDCTAGRFNWFYDADETIYVIEGDVIVKELGGVTRRLRAGTRCYFRQECARSGWSRRMFASSHLCVRRCRVRC